jgi:hypothetical protein
MTVHRKHITMDLGVTSEGGDSKDAVPTAVAAVAATDHPTAMRLWPKTKIRKHAHVFFIVFIKIRHDSNLYCT